MRQAGIRGFLVLTLLGVVGAAHGQPLPPTQLQQRGDFVIIGNTLVHDCTAGATPLVGSVSDCGSTSPDAAPDLFWSAGSPSPGNAQANAQIDVGAARSTAVLNLPPGAVVTKALLNWAATRDGSGFPADPVVTLRVPNNVIGNVFATWSDWSDNGWPVPYQSSADVTLQVQQAGQGPYEVSGVDMLDVRAYGGDIFGAWWLVVFYRDEGSPLRDFVLLDELVPSGGIVQLDPTYQFYVPPAGVEAKLAVVAFAGNDSETGDSLQLWLGSGFFIPLANASNPSSNFFNGTRSYFGQPVSDAGDLPRLTGGAGSMSGIDIDVLDVSALMSTGWNQWVVWMWNEGLGTWSGYERYFVGGLVASVTSTAPDLTHSEMIAVDLNGGILLPGDTVEYVVVVPNTGIDASHDTVLSNVLPSGLTYMGNSLEILDGVYAGLKTDASGDDQAEYDAASNTVTFRLGNAADATQGGILGVNESTTVAFRVQVDAGSFGVISNQGNITADGAYVSPQLVATLTDGNGAAPGRPPTDIVVSQCAVDSQCPLSLPFCDVTVLPQACVGCFVDAHCASPPCYSASTCHQTLRVCIQGDPLPDGTGCDDGNLCSEDDQCAGGSCLGTAIVCPAPRLCHRQDACHPLVGCPPPVPYSDGAFCEDGDLCTTDDRCISGTCVGDAVDCTLYEGCDQTRECVNGTCEPIPTPKEDTAACDDGDECTDDDFCWSGECRGVPKDSGACDDGDACTEDDACGPQGCRGTPRKCAPYRCDEASGACKVECDTVADCAPGKTCSWDRHCVDAPPSGGFLDNACALAPSGVVAPPALRPAALSLLALFALASRRRRRLQREDGRRRPHGALTLRPSRARPPSTH